MPRRKPGSTGSGWAWRADAGAPSPPVRHATLLRGGGGGSVLAAVAFLGLASAVAAAIVVRSGHDLEPEASAEAPPSEEPRLLDAEDPDGAEAADPAEATPGPAPDLETIAWTTDAPATLDELARAWSIPRDTLEALNPELAGSAPLQAGTKVVVHASTLGTGYAIGSPNDGRLTGGVPLPEGDGWLLPADRSRAFATAETIASVTAVLHAYARQFPDAEPIQIGDLSARRGGEIYGHDSHQTGLDIDIRLVRDASGEGFDPQRNWFLVKQLIDSGRVRSIFLNVTEQRWLRAAVEADVGVEVAAQYFALISHEPGHKIHMHVRFVCPDAHKRCVGYAQSDGGEQAPKVGKLPTAVATRPSKLPVLRPKSAPRPSTTPTKLPPTQRPPRRP